MFDLLRVKKMSRIGEWNCRSCQHLNLQWRTPATAAATPGCLPTSPPPLHPQASTMGGPWDWYCAVGDSWTHNFANRSTCFRCGAFKEDPSAVCRFNCSRAYGGGGGNSTGGGVRSGWKSGDWICTRLGCNEHNFTSRMECFRCSAPRDGQMQ